MKPDIIFDLGKVLVDFDYSIAAQKIRARSQNPPSAASFFENHAGLLNDFETGLITRDRFFAAARDTVRRGC